MNKCAIWSVGILTTDRLPNVILVPEPVGSAQKVIRVERVQAFYRLSDQDTGSLTERFGYEVYREFLSISSGL